MTELTEGDKQVLQNIEEYGWHVVKIMEDDEGPGFCFSIGLFKTFNHPEILIVGLKLDLAHILINNIGESIRNGKRYDTTAPHDDILDGFNCYMVDVEVRHYREYLGYATWYYEGSNFPTLQCVYPTVKGIFPWQDEWPNELKDLQPVLGNSDSQSKSDEE